MMFQEVTDVAERKRIVEYRDRIVADFFEFAPQWLDEHELLVFGDENVSHPYGLEAKALADMFTTSALSDHGLVTVECDCDVQSDDSFYLQATQEDSDKASLEFIGRNFLLYSSVMSQAALMMSTIDVRFMAGPATALEAYGGSLIDQKQRFKNFIDYQSSHVLLGTGYKDALLWVYSKLRI